MLFRSSISEREEFDFEQQMNAQVPPGGDAAPLLKVSLEKLKNERKEPLAIARSRLRGAGFALGPLQQNPALWFSRGETLKDSESALINKLRLERRKARAEKNYERSDKIRKILADLGIEIKDLPDGTDQFTFHVKAEEKLRLGDKIDSRAEMLTRMIEHLGIK